MFVSHAGGHWSVLINLFVSCFTVHLYGLSVVVLEYLTRYCVLIYE
jgi:hypothetical protein